MWLSDFCALKPIFTSWWLLQCLHQFVFFVCAELSSFDRFASFCWASHFSLILYKSHFDVELWRHHDCRDGVCMCVGPTKCLQPEHGDLARVHEALLPLRIRAVCRWSWTLYEYCRVIIQKLCTSTVVWSIRNSVRVQINHELCTSAVSWIQSLCFYRSLRGGAAAVIDYRLVSCKSAQRAQVRLVSREKRSDVELQKEEQKNVLEMRERPRSHSHLWLRVYRDPVSLHWQRCSLMRIVASCAKRPRIDCTMSVFIVWLHVRSTSKLRRRQKNQTKAIQNTSITFRNMEHMLSFDLNWSRIDCLAARNEPMTMTSLMSWLLALR